VQRTAYRYSERILFSRIFPRAIPDDKYKIERMTQRDAEDRKLYRNKDDERVHLGILSFEHDSETVSEAN